MTLLLYRLVFKIKGHDPVIGMNQVLTFFCDDNINQSCLPNATSLKEKLPAFSVEHHIGYRRKPKADGLKKRFLK